MLTIVVLHAAVLPRGERSRDSRSVYIDDEHIIFQNGQMRIPDKPSLDINENAIAEHSYQPHDLRHYTGKLTDIRPPEACSYFHSG